MQKWIYNNVKNGLTIKNLPHICNNWGCDCDNHVSKLNTY